MDDQTEPAGSGNTGDQETDEGRQNGSGSGDATGSGAAGVSGSNPGTGSDDDSQMDSHNAETDEDTASGGPA